jgi:hypothetical protein
MRISRIETDWGRASARPYDPEPTPEEVGLGGSNQMPWRKMKG